jgi:AmmeMemoRadiSam system protein B
MNINFVLLNIMTSRKKIILLAVIALLLAILISGSYFYFIKNKRTDLSILHISGAVVPHHNLVAPQRADFFSELSKQIVAPKTIILLSPNHYSAGYGDIQTASKNWNLGQGQVNSNQDVVSFLVKHNLATNEPSSFIYEHGIYNILTDIHNNFPDAELVPLIFENTSQARLNKLEQGLRDSCAGCLMIASVDFSHYYSDSLAQLQDKRSIGDLEVLNTNDIFANAEVDSRPALALLTIWAKDHNTTEFTLKNHTDSGINTQNLDSEGTTHVFGWYQQK